MAGIFRHRIVLHRYANTGPISENLHTFPRIDALRFRIIAIFTLRA